MTRGVSTGLSESTTFYPSRVITRSKHQPSTLLPSPPPVITRSHSPTLNPPPVITYSQSPSQSPPSTCHPVVKLSQSPTLNPRSVITWRQSPTPHPPPVITRSQSPTLHPPPVTTRSQSRGAAESRQLRGARLVDLQLRSRRYCSPRHRMPVNSRDEGSTCVLMTRQAISAKPAADPSRIPCY
jgi:hypothetical protein